MYLVLEFCTTAYIGQWECEWSMDVFMAFTCTYNWATLENKDLFVKNASPTTPEAAHVFSVFSRPGTSSFWLLVHHNIDPSLYLGRNSYVLM